MMGALRLAGIFNGQGFATQRRVVAGGAFARFARSHT